MSVDDNVLLIKDRNHINPLSAYLSVFSTTHADEWLMSKHFELA
jgi:hypothetical protein